MIREAHHFFANIRRESQLRNVSGWPWNTVRRGGPGHRGLSSGRPRHRQAARIRVHRIWWRVVRVRSHRKVGREGTERAKSQGQRGPWQGATCAPTVHGRRTAGRGNGLRSSTGETQREPPRPQRPQTRIL